MRPKQPELICSMMKHLVVKQSPLDGMQVHQRVNIRKQSD